MITLPAAQMADSPRIPQKEPLQKAAEELETVFLAEMLKSAGLNKAPDLFSGGAGEDQFQSFLIRAQAEQMVQSGGVGLAASLFHALSER